MIFDWPYNEIDIIEGEGLLNFGKLSADEIESARHGAQIIIRTIQMEMISGKI